MTKEFFIIVGIIGACSGIVRLFRTYKDIRDNPELYDNDEERTKGFFDVI